MRVHQPDRAAAQCTVQTEMQMPDPDPRPGIPPMSTEEARPLPQLASLRPATCHFPRALPAPWLGWRDRPFADGSSASVRGSVHTARCTLLLVSSHRRCVFCVLASVFCVGLLCSMFCVLCSGFCVLYAIFPFSFSLSTSAPTYIHFGSLLVPLSSVSPIFASTLCFQRYQHRSLPQVTGDTIRIPTTPIRDAQRTSSSFAAAPRES